MLLSIFLQSPIPLFANHIALLRSWTSTHHKREDGALHSKPIEARIASYGVRSPAGLRRAADRLGSD